MQAKRGNLPETKCRPHIRASQLTYTVKVLSLRGAQRATRQSPGREMSETNTRQPARPRWLTAERKRTEWRMRGIEPNNKRNVVFPSSVLPSRCYGNPPSPEGGRLLIGHVHDVFSSVSREIPCGRNENNRTRYAAGRGRPALPTASPRIVPPVISSVIEKSPAVETETPVHDHSNTCPQGLPAASLPASGGSPPYTTIQILARRGSLPPAHSPAQALRP